jgi:hypothetical protein
LVQAGERDAMTGTIYFRAKIEGRWRSVCLDDLAEIIDQDLADLPRQVADALRVDLAGPRWERDELGCRWLRVVEVRL